MRRLGRLWSSPLTVAPWVPSKHSEGLNQNRNHNLVKKKHEEKKNTYLRPKRRIWCRLGLLWSSPSTVARQVPEKNSEDQSSTLEKKKKQQKKQKKNPRPKRRQTRCLGPFSPSFRP